MKFNQLKISGVQIISLEKKADERGFLARTWDSEAFRENGIDLVPKQGYLTYSKGKGTMRGLHWQIEPYAEQKLTRCTKGAVYEVVIDLRPESPTYLSWEGYTFHAKNYQMIYVPQLVAHAILTLEDHTEFLNFSSQPYVADCERGIR